MVSIALKIFKVNFTKQKLYDKIVPESEVLNLKKINKFLYNTIILTTTIFLIEIIFKLINNNNIFNISTIRILLSTIIISLIISYIELYLKEDKVKTINILIIFIVTIYTILQAGFNNFLGVYISFNITSQAGAVKSYIIDFIKSFYWYYYLILIPFILIITYYILINKKIIKIKENNKFNKLQVSLALISYLLVFGFLYSLTLNLDILNLELLLFSYIYILL